MKKLLFQFDTDTHPSVFDSVVAYDGGADYVIGHGNLTPENVRALVEGTIFTRPPKDKAPYLLVQRLVCLLMCHCWLI
jgi:hypothetical protein